MPDATSSAIGGANQLKLLKQARDQILKEWDVSFAINGEVLVNIMKFATDINTDIPIKFYKDKIFIHEKSPDNIQYTEIDISSSDVLDYKPGLDGDPNRKDAKSITKGADGDYKGILIDAKGTADEIEEFAQKDDIIVVRVDTCYYKRIEFHCPGNVIVWAQLVDPGQVMKSIERLPGIIAGVRTNPNIKKAVAIIEPATFNRICAIGGKGKKRDIDERVFIELDKEDGLYITSGDKLKGRIFELKPTDVGINADSYGGGGGGMGGDNPEEFGHPEGYGQTGMTGEDDITAGMEEADMFSGEGSGIGSGNKKSDKKKPENKQVDQLLGMEVEATQFVYLNKEYLSPFAKLKGLSPIIVEVRTDKPIILEQKPYNGIKAILTIAPRIENEEDK